MAGFNKVILIGNLTRNPELRYTPSGTPVASLGLAVSRRYKQGDELKEEVCFVDIVVFGKQAEHCGQYLSKGNGIIVDGRLQQRRWETEDGQKRSKHEVVAQTVTFMPKRGMAVAPMPAAAIPPRSRRIRVMNTKNRNNCEGDVMERERGGVVDGRDGGGGGGFFNAAGLAGFVSIKARLISKMSGCLRNFLTERGRIVPRRISGQLHEAPARIDDGRQAGSAHRSHQLCGRAIRNGRWGWASYRDDDGCAHTAAG